jgi:membrane protein DedA with SNARE-associated domain
MKKFAAYLFVGLLFFAVMEYMFSVIIRGDHSNFLGSISFNAIYLTFVYFSSKAIDSIFEQWKIEDIIVYLVYGLIGLTIEWFLIGNSPWNNPDANQFTMFSYWAGAVIMARVFTSNDNGLWKLKRAILLFFIPYSVISIAVGHLLPTHELRLSIMILLAILGYDFMNLFYFWYFCKKFKRTGNVKLVSMNRSGT